MAKPVFVMDKQRVDLKDIGTGSPGGLDKASAEVETMELGKKLSELQDLMFEAGMHSLLVVLQGMDASGKDGTIRHLLQFSNAQGTRVESFKVPTPEELAHDFLWRVHKKAPGKGDMVVFNRSHYEDVLVVRVHGLVPDDVWQARYDQIRSFEDLLVSNNTLIIKFMLHISKDEQEKRLLDREKDVTKSWKLNVGDWKERELWGRYQEAYEDAISKCSAKHAPWVVVPADDKWYRNLVVTQTLVDVLDQHRKSWLQHLAEVGDKAKADLAAYRKST